MIAYLCEQGEELVQSTHLWHIVELSRKAMQSKRASANGDPQVVTTLVDLAKLIGKAMRHASQMATPVSGLTLYQNTVPTAPNPCSYEPSLLVIPQGKKRVDLGKQSYVFGGATFLLTSIELPIISRVCEASVERPYLAFFLKLDMRMIRDVLHSDEVSIPPPPAGTRGMVLGEATAQLLAPCCRMVQLLETPQDIPFFGKLLQKEIIYRLLQGTQGDRLRSVATLGDQNHRTGKAVNWLRENYEKTLNVDDLASITGMSRSTLHHHFRSLTAMSPLQFQKQLRLHAARQKMLTGELDAASAAFEVGYESPSQFNREYKRFFGQPPMRDIHALRASV
jgi:AraC-like DNA-binding protein